MATTINLDEHLLIGGSWIDATGGARFDVTDPATGNKVGSMPNGTEADVKAAIDAAAAALPGWRSTPAIQRARILRKAAELMRERAEEIATAMTSEQGKALAEAKGEVEYAASFFEWFAGEAERVYGEVVPPMNTNNRVLVLRQPVGVVAAITPWNVPAAMMTRKLGPAMAAGCTSVVKPASATPLTAALVLRCIEDAGAPAGVVNLVTSRDAGMVANTIFTDGRVKKISFTGSTEIGKDLIRASAEQVKRLSLELGGHAPYIIFDDADLDEAVEGLIASKYRNAGQTCVCANRFDVQDGVYEAVVAKLAERVRAVIAITRPAGASVIGNDRADLARACGADGVHVGQGDLSVSDVRRLAGTSLLVGVSSHSLAEARAALAAGADVCGVGAMFPTGLKPSIVPGGTAYLREYLSACGRVPHLAIGGITPANVGELAAAGCQGVAVSSVVCAARDPASVVRALVAGLGAAPSGAAAPPLSAGRA